MLDTLFDKDISVCFSNLFQTLTFFFVIMLAVSRLGDGKSVRRIIIVFLGAFFGLVVTVKLNITEVIPITVVTILIASTILIVSELFKPIDLLLDRVINRIGVNKPYFTIVFSLVFVTVFVLPLLLIYFFGFDNPNCK